MIVSSGGNSGSQAATLIIRALSTGDVESKDWRRIMIRELLSGLLLGLIVGVMGSIVISLWLIMRGETLDLVLMYQVLTIGMSLVGVVFFATLVDVTGIVIYFSIAIILLRGLVL